MNFALVTTLSITYIATAFGQQHQPEYVYTSLEPGVTSQFAVNKGTGLLTAVPGAPPALAGQPITAAPNGQFVFFGGSGISVGKIARSTGSLTAVPGSPFAADLVTETLAVTPNEHFLIAGSGNLIYTFTIDGDEGSLTPTGPPVYLSYPATGFSISPSSAVVYVDTQAGMLRYSINPQTGALSPIAVNNSGTQSVISVDGKYLYSVYEGDTSSIIYAFAVDAGSGALTPVPGSPFPGAAGGLEVIAIDPTGRFFYQAVIIPATGSGGITEFLINSLNGALEGTVPGSPFSSSGPSTSIVVDHSGRFLYTPGGYSGVINEFALNPVTGALSPIPGTPPYVGFPAFTTLAAPSPVTHATLVSLSIEPTNPSVYLMATSTEQFTALGTYSDGTHRFLTASATWTSSNPSVATISNSLGQSGLATVFGSGETVIEASLNGVSVQTTLTVQIPALVSIAVTPNSPAVKVGTAIQLAATGTYGDGTMKDITKAVTWVSSNAGVAPINQSGLAYGKTVGASTIKAVSGQVTGSMVLTVTPR